jgi:3-oxoadipate enol-lactonase / 4-carboxymuconolactone decarboxylase
VKLHARVDGPDEAPPLVLLASVGGTTQMWTPVLGPLVEQFRVVRIDHRGHGDSPAARPSLPCSIADLADDVVDTLDEVGIDRADIAGISLGGMTGMWLAVHRPERVKRLALLCTSAYLPPAQGWLDRASAVRTGGMAAIVEPVVARWITAELADRDAELLAALKAMLAGVEPESYAQCCEAIAAMDLRPDLARIAAPTLVLAADHDTATPIEHARTVAAGIPDARLATVERAAHIATVEQPGHIASLLLEHFRGGATLAAGVESRRAVLGDEHVDRVLASTTPLSRPFQEFLTRYAWGDVWTRAELTRRDRSVVTLTALIALGAEHELAMHVRAARRNGLTDTEIAEIVLHAALYAGLPRSNRAMTIVNEVLASG